jgi:spore germination protein KA
MARFAPKTMPGLDAIIRGPLYRKERRPDELQTQDEQRQPHISRGWIKDKPEGSDHP